MTRITSIALVLLSLSLFVLPSCGGGGSGAALSYHVFPGDRVVTGRRLEALARQFEQQYGCVETDTIGVVGFAPQTYNVDGCGHVSDYVLQCSAGGGYGGYGGSRCAWEELASLAQQAATDFRCDAAAVDYQVTQGFVRQVSGCGYQANYQFDRGQWMLLGRIEQIGPVTSGATTVSGSVYVQ